MTQELAQLIAEFGRISAVHYWIPMIVWSIAAVFSLVAAHTSSIHPAIRGGALGVLLALLPMGVLLTFIPVAPNMPIAGASQEWVSTVTFSAMDVVGRDPQSVPGSPASSPLTIPFWIGLLTIGALMCSLARLRAIFGHVLSLRRLVSAVRMIEPREICSRYPEILEAAGLQPSNRVRIAVSETQAVPITFGWLRPVVVLPAELARSERDMEIALLHELVHVRRRDYLRRFIEIAAEVPFAVNPVVRRLITALDDIREETCDADVISRYAIKPADYGYLLYRFHAQVRSSTLALSICRPGSQLARRMKSIENQMESPLPLRTIRLLKLGTGASLAGIVLTMLAFSHPQAEFKDRHDRDFQLRDAVLRVNDETVASRFNLKESSSSVLYVYYEPVGLVTFALAPFYAATEAGIVEGNTLRLSLPNVSIELTSDTALVDAKRTVWARHDASYDGEKHLGGGLYSRSVTQSGGHRMRDGERYSWFVGAVSDVERLFTPVDGSEKLAFHVQWVEVNGDQFSVGVGGSASTGGYIDLFFPGYGRFILAAHPFEGAEHVAKVRGTRLVAETDEVRFVAQGTSPFVAEDEATLWFRYDDDYWPLDGDGNPVKGNYIRVGDLLSMMRNPTDSLRYE